MIPGWVLALTILFVILFGIVIVFLMRINTNLEIVVRSIPLGTPKIMERRPSGPPPEEQRGTRPVGSTATGRHG
jgi:uncharacterized membrane protein YqiK